MIGRRIGKFLNGVTSSTVGHRFRGGHRELWIDHEGYNVAEWLREHGVAAFVLKYRLAKEEGSTYTVEQHALWDIQRGIRLVRANARQLGFDPARIGVLGFSAGGELAARAAMSDLDGDPGASDPIDRLSSRPAFEALIYPGNSAALTVSKRSPPVFIAAGYNDRPDIAKGMAELYLEYEDAGVPAELHMYAAPRHGFGVRANNRSAAGGWPARQKLEVGDRVPRNRERHSHSLCPLGSRCSLGTGTRCRVSPSGA